jgi:beta-N-acetylhexosaminidase
MQTNLFLKTVYSLTALFVTVHLLNGQAPIDNESAWISSKLNSMSTDEKIGQLFMVRSYSLGHPEEEQSLLQYIKEYYIGGVCFFKGSPAEQISIINSCQQHARVPLLMAIDGEWGLGMRFPKTTVSFPRQMMLGAVRNNNLIYEMGREVARQCKRIGIHMNFAPSVDINSNPRNPVIYDRSFGEDPQNVTAKGYMYMHGMEQEGVLPCIKHFPGHGDTDVDSHRQLPVLNHSAERLESMELYPFRKLANQGDMALMVGHLSIPVLDDRPNKPASLSDKIITSLVRQDMGFEGLIVTDAMDMGAITGKFANGQAEAEAFLAGNDIILLPQHLPAAFQAIKNMIAEGKITMDRIDSSVERILRAKYRLGLTQSNVFSSEGLDEYLNSNRALAIKQKITEAAVTLVADEGNHIPLRQTSGINIATLSINVSHQTAFQDRVDSYADARHYQLMPQQTGIYAQQYLQTLSKFDHVLVTIHTSGKQTDFSRTITGEVQSFLKSLEQRTRVTTILFGNPYLAKQLNHAGTLLVHYDNETLTQDVTAQAVFGAIDINGFLPVSVSDRWSYGHGIERKSLERLGYGVPEMVGLSSDTLALIDQAMMDMMRIGAAPGGQVLIARGNKIIFQKSYGQQTYKGAPVTNETIYDLASVTKMLSTTLAVMKLMEDKKLSLNTPIRNYLAGIDSTDKAGLTIAEIMTHHARLQPSYNFYVKTLPPRKKKGINRTYYSPTLKPNFTIPVAQDMFLRTDYKDSIYQKIWKSSLRPGQGYKYSDLGFYIMQKIVEELSGTSLDVFVNNAFYSPLGLKYTGYKPILKHPAHKIAPTEIDKYFRMQTIQGYVHDMGAAMLGGVAGHAGLFSNATETAILMQMLLNKGSYGGVQLLKPETVDIFTQRYRGSTRRGIGFDMKELDAGKQKSTSTLASPVTFGHTGFTGTAAWADPENGLVYVFIANRTFPGRLNQRFNNRDYRIKVQAIIYRAMLGLQPLESL